MSSLVENDARCSVDGLPLISVMVVKGLLLLSLNTLHTCRSGSILDSFLGSNDPNSFSCQAGKVPIGFAASSSCFAVTNFQVSKGRMLSMKGDQKGT